MYTKSLGLALTLAIALMTLGYANPSFAAPKKCVADPDAPGCGGDDPPPPPTPALIYTVEVDAGSFSFGPEPATLNGNETALSVTAEVTFYRPGGDDPICSNFNMQTHLECLAWDDVFNQCATPYGPTLVPVIQSFVVSAGNLSVQRSGGRRVEMDDILLPNPDLDPPVDPFVEVWVHLIGPENNVLPLLPRDDSGQLIAGTRAIPMERVWFGGRTVKGITPKMACHPKGNGIPDTVDILDGGRGILVITATPE